MTPPAEAVGAGPVAARRYVLEVGVTGADEAVRAVANGADRLELCGALEVGGVTPSPAALLDVLDAVRVPVYVLLRSRVGGFTLSGREFTTLRRDAAWFLANGAAGVVFGILTHQDGANVIDAGRCREVVGLASGRGAVFHRAFDFVSDPFAALEELADIGFARVQTSGGAATAGGGAGRLAAWLSHAGARIEVMPAGGITPATVGDLLRKTRAGSVHASLRETTADPSLLANPGLGAGMGVPNPAAGRRTTSAALVRQMREALDALSAAGGDPEQGMSAHARGP